MTPRRIHYLKSNTYRSTLRVGDRIIGKYVYENDGEEGLIFGTIATINRDEITIRWKHSEACNIILLRGNSPDNDRFLAFKIEDLTPKERSEIVTMRLSQ